MFVIRGGAMHASKRTDRLDPTSLVTDRRSFLRLAGAASVGFALLLEACQPARGTPSPGSTVAPLNSTTAAPTLASGSAGARSAARVQFPTYVPLQGAKPDLP